MADVAVVELEFPEDLFSGVLVGERVVLTAAHPLRRYESGEQGVVHFGQRTTGDGAAPDESIPTVEWRIHPYYDVDTDYFFDVALVLLQRAPAGVVPVPINRMALDTLLSPGDTVRAVGFGFDSENRTGGGERRTAQLEVSEVQARHLHFDDPTSSPCAGDSGGPLLVDVDGAEAVVALVSMSTAEVCGGAQYHTRIDRYIGDFIEPTLARWAAGCAEDGVCEPACNESDPDCVGCGLDGQCTSACRYDPDCRVRSFGDTCTAHSDCPSGICIRAVDDASVRYCTLPCATEFEAKVCGALATCGTSPDASEPVCVYGAPTPLPVGSPCEEGRGCRSGQCECGGCVKRCGRERECPLEHDCVNRLDGPVCVPADTGCGCASAASSGGWLLALVCWAWIRRRGSRAGRAGRALLVGTTLPRRHGS